ncbi:MAG: methyltransferase domain-containing protein [Chloroflexota bacterium]
MNTPLINYRVTWEVNQEYPDMIKDWIGRTKARRICDIGGGANPLLDLDFVRSLGLEYTILDISESELAKAPNVYHKKVQNIEAPDFSLADQFDLVFSMWLAEHIRNGRQFHQNIHQMLKPAGVAIHYFPTLYALPFLINRLTPEFISAALQNLFAPRDKFRQGKFTAHYSWCYGPTPPMLGMLKSIGFEVLEFNALFGHMYYYQKVPLLRDIHRKRSEYLACHPNPYLTSFARIVLAKAG